MRSRLDLAGLLGLVLVTAYMCVAAPGAFWKHPEDACYWGVRGSLATSLLVLALRLIGRSGSVVERVALMLFLAGMPVIYLVAWWSHAAAESGWGWIELGGVALYGGLAVASWRWPWLLAAGIAGHGLLWDLGHRGRTTFVPDWYALGCLIVDLGFGAYVAAQVPRWREKRS